MSSVSPEPSPRLYFIVAREAPVAVVFRRGPSQFVELLSWDLVSDELTPGQWLKGRIYERVCDLSPKGDLLVYFAAKWAARPIEEGSWTAVSHPPYLSALALWFNGDVTGGGGLFDTDRLLRLDGGGVGLGEGFELPGWMRVASLHEQFPERPRDPIEDMRLRRDGWERVDHASEPPVTYRRRLGAKDRPVTREMAIEGVGWASKLRMSYRLLDGDRELRSIGPADWADADPNGDLLLARDGRLFRLSGHDADTFRAAELREVADLRAHRFEERVAPAEAMRW